MRPARLARPRCFPIVQSTNHDQVKMFFLATSLLVAGLPSLAIGSSGDTYSGPAVVHEEISVSGDEWDPWALAMDDGWLAIGHRDASRVEVYKLGQDGWGLFEVLTVPEGFPDDSKLGRSVAIDAGTIAVGSAASGTDWRGAILLYELDGSGWNLTQVLDPDLPGQNAFGFALDVDGDRLIAEDYMYGGTGAAFLYERNATGQWNRIRDFYPDSSQDHSHDFARDVAVSGETVAIGHPDWKTSGGVETGAVYVHERSGGSWPVTQILHPGGVNGPEYFGFYVAVDGPLMAVGANDWDGSPNQQLYNGTVYTFVSTDTGWVHDQLVSPNAVGPGSNFPSDLDLEGTRLIVGEEGTNYDGVSGSGRAFIYDRTSNGWSLNAKLGSPSPKEWGYLGRVTAISGDWAAVGEPDINNLTGTTYVFGPGGLAAGGMLIQAAAACASAADPCGEDDLGYSDVPSILSGGQVEFRIPVGEMGGYQALDCNVRSCDLWLELNATFQGAISQTVSPGDTTTVATVSAQQPDGTFQAMPGAEIEADLEVASDGELSLDLPQTVRVNASFLHPEDGVVTLRLEPTANQWSVTADTWDISANAAQLQLIAHPVVLVQGWAKETGWQPGRYYDTSTWTAEYESFLRVEALERYGQDPWAWAGPAGIKDDVTYNRKGDFRFSALWNLTDAMDRLPPEVGFLGPVDVVTHSMGGLLARYLVEPTGQSGSPSGLDRTESVRKVVTMGTPHLGSPWADDRTRAWDDKQTNGEPGSDRFYLGHDGLNVGEYYECKIFEDHNGNPEVVCADTGFKNWREWWESTIEANRYESGTPGHDFLADFELKDASGYNPVLEDLNGLRGGESTQYLFIAGEASIGPHVWHGDGIVSTGSQTLAYTPRFCHQVIQVDYPPFTAVGDHGPSAHVALPYLDPIRQPAFDFLADRSSAGCDQPGTNTDPQETPTRDARSSDSTSQGLQSLATASSYEGSLSWNITRASEVIFDVFAPNGSLGSTSALDLRLEAPNGSWSSPDNGTLSGVHWSVVTGTGYQDSIQIAVPEPGNGTWTLRIGTSAGPLDAVRGRGLMDTPLRLASMSDNRTTVGTPALIEVGFTDGGAPVKGASVAAEVYDPRWNATETLTLVDTGAAPDQQADDGIYTAEYTPLRKGQKEVSVTATSTVGVREIAFGLSVTGTAQDSARSCAVLAIQPSLATDLLQGPDALEPFEHCLTLLVSEAVGVVPAGAT